MTSAVNNYNYSSGKVSSLPSSVKEIQENPENFRLYMAQFGNSVINSLNSSALYDENGDSSDSGSSDALFNSLGMSAATGLSGESTGVDPLSLFSSSGSNSSSALDFSSLLGTPSLDSFQVSETLEQLKKYSDLTETKRWVGQTISYIDPSDKTMKSGLVSKVIVENVEKPVLVVDGKEISVDDMVSIDINNQTV